MNNELLLQISKGLVVHGVLNGKSRNDKFKSVYSLDGAHILPPLMTDSKRLEMQHLRLQALAIEVTLKMNKLAIGEKQMKCLMPSMVNASTNTAENPNPNPSPNPGPDSQSKPNTVPVPTSVPAPIVVMGRFRQKLQKSETSIFDHSTKELVTVAPAKTLPISIVSHEVIEDKPQQAVILPMETGTLKSSWVPKISPCEPLRCSTSTIDLRVQTVQRRMPERSVVFPTSPQISVFSSKRPGTTTSTIDLRMQKGQERMPERPVVFPSSTKIPVLAESKLCSRIPVRSHRPTVLHKLQPPPEISMLATGLRSCQERNGMKADSANERRRNYAAKVTMKRNEITKKRDALAKLKPPPRTTNQQVPKSIRTPIRRIEAGIEEPQKEQQEIRCQPINQQPISSKTYNNQVPKSIITPIRRLEGGESPLEQQRLQIHELIQTNNNNNQIPKSIRTPMRRVDGGESPLEQQRFQGQESSHTNNNNQIPKSIRTPIMEAGIEEPQKEQQENRVQPINQQPVSSQTNNNQFPKSIRTPIRRVEGGESPLEQQQQQINNNTNQVLNGIRSPIRRVEAEIEEPQIKQQVNLFQPFDQQAVSSKTINGQVPKSIRTPIRRVEAEIEESELQKRWNFFESFFSRQETEQQRLQVQMEQQQQGLIDQLVGQIASSDSQDTASEVVVEQDQ